MNAGDIAIRVCAFTTWVLLATMIIGLPIDYYVMYRRSKKHNQ